MTRTLTVFALAFFAAACSGPIFGSRDAADPTPSNRDRGPTVDELLQLRVDTLPMSAEGAESLRELARAIETAREDDRPRLTAHRGNLLADFVQAHAAWERVDPARGEWYAAAAGVLVGVDAASPEYGERTVTMVHTEAGQAVAAVVARILTGAPAPTDAPAERAAIAQLVDVSNGFAAWSRYGAPALPLAPEATECADLVELGLASSSNVELAGLLAAVVGVADRAEALDTPLALAVAEVARDLRTRALASAVPLELPLSLIADDARLSPPRSFQTVAGDSVSGLGFTFRRVVVVRTTGVRVLIHPHVQHGETGLSVVGAAEGWSLPGASVLEFNGPGAIPPDAIVGDSVPAVESAFTELEALLDGAAWLPAEETRRESGSVGVSVIADGDTYYATLRPMLTALWVQGYGPIALHTFDPAAGRLDAVAVRLVEGVAVHDNVITVREDGYLVSGYDPENLETPTTISRVAPGALAALYTAVAEGFENGTLDPDQPLTVQVDDNSVDYGVLAHLLAAVSFVRHGESSTDLELLSAPVTQIDGMAQVLAPRGLRLSL